VAVVLRLGATGGRSFRGFHEHHIGAEVGKEPARESRSAIGEIDDTHSGERK
jgi:hypothetical protein